MKVRNYGEFGNFRVSFKENFSLSLSLFLFLGARIVHGFVDHIIWDFYRDIENCEKKFFKFFRSTNKGMKIIV